MVKLIDALHIPKTRKPARTKKLLLNPRLLMRHCTTKWMNVWRRYLVRIWFSVEIFFEGFAKLERNLYLTKWRVLLTTLQVGSMSLLKKNITAAKHTKYKKSMRDCNSFSVILSCVDLLQPIATSISVIYPKEYYFPISIP